jgi:serine/threonine protein kinase
LGNSAGTGGEATVYTLKDRPGWLAKIYKAAPRPNYARKLNWMVAHPPANPTNGLDHSSLAWPTELVYDSRRKLTGYLMPYIQGTTSLLEVFNPRRRAETLPGFNRRYLHRTARNLAATLEVLHTSGYVVGDLNESNVLVTPSALVTLIDADSFQVQEQRNGRLINYPCPVGKLEYTPPELQGKTMEKVLRLPQHDSFGLGVLIFQLLMEGNHPFRAQWLRKGEPPPIEARIAQGLFPYTASASDPVRPPRNAPNLDNLHPALVALILRCFMDGQRDPTCRPSPAEWEQGIRQAEKELFRCSQGHIYSLHLSACPKCPPAPASKEPYHAKQPIPKNAARRPSPTNTPSSPTANPTPQPQPAATPPSANKPRQAAPPVTMPSLSQWLKGQLQAFTIPNWPSNQTVSAPAIAQPSAQTKLIKSLMVGGSLGALAGMVSGGFVGLVHGSLGNAAAWSLIWASGGVAAGLMHGWKPGYRLAQRVGQYIGWERFWVGLGLLGGATLGGMLGMVFWWAIFPIFIGLFAGARLGFSIGRKIWMAGNRYGWERIWAVLAACGAAALGWMIARWASAIGLGSLSDQFAGFVADWLTSHSVSWPLVLAATGALGGAFGGAIAGTITNLFGRLAGLVD